MQNFAHLDKNEEKFEKFQENFEIFSQFFTKYFLDFCLLSESIYLWKITPDFYNNFSDFGGGAFRRPAPSRRYWIHLENFSWKIWYFRNFGIYHDFLQNILRVERDPQGIYMFELLNESYIIFYKFPHQFIYCLAFILI